MGKRNNTERKEILHNRFSREDLLKIAKSNPIERKTFSFYRYTTLDNVQALRNQLYRAWDAMGVLGRIYLAREGINAQLAVPVDHVAEFKSHLDSISAFKNMRYNPGVEDNGHSFIKLTVKVKKQIVADGLGDFVLSQENQARHLTPLEFNQALEKPEVIVVDMRNQYESKVGHFENAILPDVDTFRDELPLVANLLAEKKEKKILIYCTGGIRCEKAGAYLKERGFQDVNQLLGGIINYAHTVKQHGLQSKFKGKNFVFDERRAERITEDVLSRCQICDALSDRQVNCANEGCHALMIQCEACSERLNDCCSDRCREISFLPEAERRRLRKSDASLSKTPWFSKKLH